MVVQHVHVLSAGGVTGDAGDSCFVLRGSRLHGGGFFYVLSVLVFLSGQVQARRLIAGTEPGGLLICVQVHVFD